MKGQSKRHLDRSILSCSSSKPRVKQAGYSALDPLAELAKPPPALKKVPISKIPPRKTGMKRPDHRPQAENNGIQHLPLSQSGVFHSKGMGTNQMDSLTLNRPVRDENVSRYLPLQERVDREKDYLASKSYFVPMSRGSHRSKTKASSVKPSKITQSQRMAAGSVLVYIRMSCSLLPDHSSKSLDVRSS